MPSMRGAVVRSSGVAYGRSIIGVQAQTYWNDGPLKSKAVAAFRSAGMAAGNVARGAASWGRVRRSVRTFFSSGGIATGLNIAGIIRAGHPLARILEGGAQAHAIAPRNSLQSQMARGRLGGGGISRRIRTSRSGHVAMRFPDGGFSRGSVEHPGIEARPFMRPAAAAFPALFRDKLRRLL